MSTDTITEDVALIYYGPLYRFWRRLGLITPQSLKIPQRILTLFLVTWVPLLLLTTLNGTLYGNAVTLPFVRDIDANVRLLIIIPLLLFVEALIVPRLVGASQQFVPRGIIRAEDSLAFQDAVAETKRWSDSALMEGLLLLAALVGGGIGILQDIHTNPSSWLSLQSGDQARLTVAGWWYLLIGSPLSRFLVYRWLWAMVIWARFLWRVSRLDLRLYPTHPDQAGGLGFVESSQNAFGWIIMALSILLSASLCGPIYYQGISVKEYENLLKVFLVLCLILVMGPLLVFAPPLRRARSHGMRAFGALACDLSDKFEKKWMQGHSPEAETILGNPDPSSLIDLGGAYQSANKMRSLLVSRNNVITLALMAAIPLIPLYLSTLSLKEILLKILKLVT